MRRVGTIAIVSLFVIGGFLGIISIVNENASALIWSTESVNPGGKAGAYTSIALDSSDHPHISYFNITTDDLKYAKWNGSAWSIETVDSAGIVGHYSSIAVDGNGYPHISYEDVTFDDLKYAR